MTTALTLPALKRLAAILERTASPFDAERLTALSLAKQLLDAAGMGWADVLHAEPPVPVVVHADRTWRQCAEQCLYDHTQALSEWEQGFVQDVLRRGRALSSKQAAVLRRIAEKCGVPDWEQWP
jgi:membrane-bound lytic murein transglycosylase B